VARPQRASRAPASTAPKAFLGGLFGGSAGKKDGAEAPAYICTACGFIYDGDFKSAPGSYKCPVCNVPKSKFKVYKGNDVKGRPNNAQGAMQKRFKAKQW